MTKKTVEMAYKKCTRKTPEVISANPERKIFEIFNAVLIMVASQGDTKLNKALAHQNMPWI